MTTRKDFESFLDEVTGILGGDVRAGGKYHEAGPFQDRVLRVMQNVAHKRGLQITPTNHPHAFPDIKANGFGVEVKSTRQDTWDATANSVLESMRDKDAKQVYVVFGKMGGMPGVRWRRYEDAIHHVRISHAPRFVLGMDTPTGKSLFDTIGVPYEEFAAKIPAEKMDEVRKYARSRLAPGERLWWLEEHHTVDLELRRYQDLPEPERRRVRGSTAAVCPEIVGPPHKKDKYSAAVKFAASYLGVWVARDMFTAGSAGGFPKCLLTARAEMMDAFQNLPRGLFEEYWPEGAVIPDDAEGRKKQWLRLADVRANGWWTPSEHLFL